MTKVYLENPDAAVRLYYSNVLPMMKSQKRVVFTTQLFLLIIDVFRHVGVEMGSTCDVLYI